MSTQGFPNINDLFADRYLIQSELGRGGMGVVFRAWDQVDNRAVAIKLVQPSLGREAHIFDRFAREIRALRQLNHPNIVAIHEDGRHNDLYYFTMELAVGPTLASYVDPVDRLPLPQALYLFGQVCSALHHAHSRGVVHRDLKPTNILIQDSKTVKLLDFGLARLKDDTTLTLPGQALGTAAYMAPEVGRGEEAGPAADIYALGCLFFQLLTGMLPFKGESPVDVIVQHQTAEAPRVREFRPDASENMERAILRALDKNPRNRFASALDYFRKLARADDAGSSTSGSFQYPPVADAADSFESLTEDLASSPWMLLFDEPIPGAGVLGSWKVTPSPDGEWLAVGADAIEGPLLFNIKRRSWQRLGDHGAGRNVRAICWSRSGRLMSFVNSRRLVLVDMSRNQCVARLDVSNHRPWSIILIPTANGRPMPVACGESGGVVAWRDWPDATPAVFRAHQGVARTIRLAPGGGYFVTGGLDSAISFWRSSDFRPLRRLEVPKAAIWALAFSRTGQYLAAASSNQQEPALIYRVASDRLEPMNVKLRGRALGMIFSQSERMIAVGCHQRICFLELDRSGTNWDVTEVAEIDGEVRSLAFDNADRTMYAVTSLGRLVAFRRGGSSASDSLPVLTQDVDAPAGSTQFD